MAKEKNILDQIIGGIGGVAQGIANLPGQYMYGDGMGPAQARRAQVEMDQKVFDWQQQQYNDQKQMRALQQAREVINMLPEGSPARKMALRNFAVNNVGGPFSLDAVTAPPAPDRIKSHNMGGGVIGLANETDGKVTFEFAPNRSDPDLLNSLFPSLKPKGKAPAGNPQPEAEGDKSPQETLIPQSLEQMLSGHPQDQDVSFFDDRVSDENIHSDLNERHKVLIATGLDPIAAADKVVQEYSELADREKDTRKRYSGFDADMWRAQIQEQQRKLAEKTAAEAQNEATVDNVPTQQNTPDMTRKQGQVRAKVAKLTGNDKKLTDSIVTGYPRAAEYLAGNAPDENKDAIMEAIRLGASPEQIEKYLR